MISKKNKYHYLIRLFVAVVLLVILFVYVGHKEIGVVLKAVEVKPLVWSVLLIILALVLSGLGLWVVVRRSGEHPLLFVRAYIVSAFVALWLPGRIGDFSIVYMLRKHYPSSEVFVSVIVDKVITLIILSYFTIFVSFVYVSLVTGIVAFVGCTGFWLFYFYISTHRKFATVLIKKSPRKIRKKAVEVLLSTHRAFEYENHASLLMNGVIKIIRIMVVGWLMVVLLDAFGQVISFKLALMGTTVAQFLSMIPVSIQGAGLQEFAYVYLYNLELVTPAAVLLASLTSRVLSMLIVGGLYFVNNLFLPTSSSD